MKLKHNAIKGERINYRFFGFTTYDNYWYNYTLKRWENGELRNDLYSYSSHEDCRTVRAFRRKLKSAPKGVKFVLSSRWIGNDVEGIGTGNELK